MVAVIVIKEVLIVELVAVVGVIVIVALAHHHRAFCVACIYVLAVAVCI